MKKFYQLFTVICCFAFISSVNAQLITIPAANTQGTGASTSVFRKPYGTNRSYERTAIKYTHAEIGVNGYITSIGFYVDSLNNHGDAITRIFMKEVSDSTFAPSTVAAEETGAQLVFDDTIPASSFVDGQWTTVTLATPFLHASTMNIEIIIETNSGGTAGTDPAAVSKGFRYTATTGNREQYWQSATGSGTPPATNGTLSAYRHNVQLNFVPATSCTAPPNAGATASSVSAACSGSQFMLSLNGATTGTGITYQWLSSADGITWTPIAGAASSSLSTSQTADTYYTAIVTCSAQSDTASPLLVTLNAFYNCYCSNLGGSCTSSIDSVAITSTTLANGPTGCAAPFYTMYPAGGTTTATLTQGQTYQLVVEHNGAAKTSVWIDYNHNGVFDTNEWTQVSLTSSAGVPVMVNINVPLTSLTGLTGMRIRSRTTSGANDSTTACTTFGSGEVEDYLITISPSSACVAPPNAGVATANPDTVCSGTSTTVSIAGYTTGTGTTFQWISSTDAGATWAPVAGATNFSMTDTPAANTWYACIVTCSGQSDTSTSAMVYVNPFYNCYCKTGLGGSCTASIDSVSFTGTTLANGPTGCGAGFYTSFPGTGNTTATLVQGQTYQLATKYTGNAKASLWIDYDHNGVFNTYEWTQVTLTSAAGATILTNVSVPFSAMTGVTGMRIRSRLNTGTNDSASACSNFGSGEIEDYLIDIVAASPCTAPPTAGNASASTDTVCAGTTSAITLSGYTSGTGTTFQWIASTDGGATWTPVAGATSTSYTASPSATTWYAAIVTCTGQSDTSTAAMVFVNAFYNCYCTNIGGGCVSSPGTTIDSVAIASTTLANGPTGCSPSFYTMYPAGGNTTATLVTGQAYNIDVLLQGSAKCAMWIDYNQNGTFESSEGIQVCTTSTAGVVNTAGFTVPMGAMTGLTGMRVRSRSTAGTMDTTSACIASGSGETEDYLVTIDLSIGMKNAERENSMYVFPNPTNGLLNIAATFKKSSQATWSVVNMAGENVMTESGNVSAGVNTRTMSISHLPKGIYFVRMVSDNETIIKKVILQ